METVAGILLSYRYVTEFCTRKQADPWTDTCTCCHLTPIYFTTNVILAATGSCHWLCNYNVI